MTITANTVITWAAVLAAILAFAKYYNKVYDLVKHQKEQDTEIADVKAKSNDAINSIKTEQTLIVYGVLACLRGLKEQGCDGDVTETIKKIEKHLNIAAHS